MSNSSTKAHNKSLDVGGEISDLYTSYKDRLRKKIVSPQSNIHPNRHETHSNITTDITRESTGGGSTDRAKHAVSNFVPKRTNSAPPDEHEHAKSRIFEPTNTHVGMTSYPSENTRSRIVKSKRSYLMDGLVSHMEAVSITPTTTASTTHTSSTSHKVNAAEAIQSRKMTPPNPNNTRQYSGHSGHSSPNDDGKGPYPPPVPATPVVVASGNVDGYPNHRGNDRRDDKHEERRDDHKGPYPRPPTSPAVVASGNVGGGRGGNNNSRVPNNSKPSSLEYSYDPHPGCKRDLSYFLPDDLVVCDACWMLSGGSVYCLGCSHPVSTPFRTPSKKPSQSHVGIEESPCTKNEQSIHESAQSKLLDCFMQNISLRIGDDVQDFSDKSCVLKNAIKSLKDSQNTSTSEIYDKYEIQESGLAAPSVNFRLAKLRRNTERHCQDKYLSPHAQNPALQVFDTHKSNTTARNLCVAPMNSSGYFEFECKPDLIHGKIPMILEIKSRVSEEKKEDIKARDTITNVEIDTFQQCLDRIITQSQFKAYLSKIFVFGSTGFVSWIFVYTFDVQTNKGAICVYQINNDDVNKIWCDITYTVSVKKEKFFQTRHAPILAATIRRLYASERKPIDLNRIRVSVANKSMSMVYFVTSCVANKYVEKNKKHYALKVVEDGGVYSREDDLMNKIKEENAEFYYLNSSTNLIDTVNLVNHPEFETTWFSYDNNFVPVEGGVIVMEPGSRSELLYSTDNYFRVYNDLLRCVLLAHKAGVLHTDIRPRNCVKFGNQWHLVDFGLSVLKESPSVRIKDGDGRNDCLGVRVGDRLRDAMKVGRTSVKVDWTEHDDLEQLFNCMSLCVNLKK